MSFVVKQRIFYKHATCFGP